MRDSIIIKSRSENHRVYQAEFTGLQILEDSKIGSHRKRGKKYGEFERETVLSG